ncbi:MAG: methionine adenosyltransferase [Clostridiales bacterium]|nr:methionine adenosyltransferase [Clostridiales bacterium]
MTSFFTSESVTEGHPDKMADQISDAILDAMLAKDKKSRVACETLVTTGVVLVAGEISTDCYVDIPNLVRNTVRDIGYTRAKFGFDYETCAVMTCIDEQSADIAMGVDQALESKQGDKDSFAITGAGDQGMMFGYACDETPELMPLPISLAHQLTRRLAAVRKAESLSPLLPDGKSQVTVEYDAAGKPLRIDTVVVSTQHRADIDLDELRPFIIERVIKDTLSQSMIDERTRFLINPTGRFVIGGPHGDSGLTGRKIIVDTYGGMARHGGGAFSGKDPTKVDRSASYMARYIAKNIVAAGLAARCEVQLAYAIGVAEPVSLRLETFGTGRVADYKLTAACAELFDTRPAAIISHFDLLRPIYKQVAAYGHFGRNDLDLPWEKTDRVEDLRGLAK